MPLKFINGRPDISPKQISLVKLCQKKDGQKKVVLMSGPRKSSKTCAGLVALADHLWNVNNASVLVLCKTQGSGATSGVWNELTEEVLPSYVEANFGMEWAPKGSPPPWNNGGDPKIHGATKKMMCAVVNKHGGISEVVMDSLDDEREVEDKYKSRYLSMIYWSEASEFHERKSFSTLLLALRGFDLPDQDCVFLIDCNPAETGKDHFLYKLFYELRISEDVDEDEKIYQTWLHLTEWKMSDNPYISENEKAVIRAEYKHSPSLYARYVLGEWQRVVEKGLFTKQFSLAKHTVGDIADPDSEYMIPMDGCTALITGHDEGGVNPVSYIVEKCILRDGDKEVSIFRFLDELAFVGEEISPEEFTLLLLPKIDFWEGLTEKDPEWTHWSDSSALDRRQSISKTTVADEIFAVSGGRIKLESVQKGSGSVGGRIRLWRKLLMQGRILISAGKCPRLVAMNQNIQTGKAPDTIPKGSEFKHSFDAASYIVAQECWDEMQNSIIDIRSATRSPAALISIPM